MKPPFEATHQGRNKWGAISGYCPCGNSLSFAEMDWNDGLCDECVSGEDDDDSEEEFDDE